MTMRAAMLEEFSGTYGSPPRLPVVPGFEGCGTVVASGGGWLANRLVGRRVAGASQLGRMLVRLSTRHGFPLINIVHREALVAELQAAGARHVLDSSRADFAASLTALARDLRATWAADAVAGSMTGILATCMPSGSTIAVYGVLSGSGSHVPPGDLIFRGQTVTGYWVSREFQDRSPLGLPHISRLLRSARRLLTSDLQSNPQAHVPLTDIAARLPELLESTSKGKISISPGR